MPRPAPTRWGRVSELPPTVPKSASTRYRHRAFQESPYRIKHLATFRYAHLLGSHKQYRAFARRQGVKPTSDLSLRQKLAYIYKRS